MKEIKVTYAGDPVRKLDNKIIKGMKKAGFKGCILRYSYEKNEREISFEVKEKIKND